jgi:hypothetical protein
MANQEPVAYPYRQRNSADGLHSPEYEQCLRRHQRIRLFVLLTIDVLLFLCAVIFFTVHTLVPILIVAALSILLYTTMNKRLRRIEKQYVLMT